MRTGVSGKGSMEFPGCGRDSADPVEPPVEPLALDASEFRHAL